MGEKKETRYIPDDYIIKMEEKKETRYIPNNYYIFIADGQGGNYNTNREGGCYVLVYKRLEGEHERTSVEHVLKIGSFSVRGEKNMNTDEFLRKVREGIEKIISSETKLPISIPSSP